MAAEPEYDVIPDEPEILPAEDLIEPATLDHLVRWSAGLDVADVTAFLQQAAVGLVSPPAGPAFEEVLRESRVFGESSLPDLPDRLAETLGLVAQQAGAAGYILGRTALGNGADEPDPYDSEITWDIVARLDWADLMERVGPWSGPLVEGLLADVEVTPTENDDIEGVAQLAFGQGFAYAVVEYEYLLDLA